MEKYIGIVTINNRIYITISFNTKLVSYQEIEAIKHNIIKSIEAM